MKSLIALKFDSLDFSLEHALQHFRSVFMKSVIFWDSHQKPPSIVFVESKRLKIGVKNQVVGESNLVEIFTKRPDNFFILF